MLLSFAPSSTTESALSSMNLWIAHVHEMHSGVTLDCKSANGFNFALPDICFGIIEVLFIFVRKLDILALVENFPSFTNFKASLTGLLSVSIIRGCLLSLMMSYSLSTPTANASASVSHGDHL